MKVRAIANTGSGLPVEALSERWGITTDSEFNVSVGAEYTVFAVTALGDSFWYYILNEDDTGCPIWHPCPLFEVVDGEIPEWWVANYLPHTTRSALLGTSILSFPAWANDPLFYEKLYDGDPDATAAFREEEARQGP